MSPQALRGSGSRFSGMLLQSSSCLQPSIPWTRKPLLAVREQMISTRFNMVSPKSRTRIQPESRSRKVGSLMAWPWSGHTITP